MGSPRAVARFLGVFIGRLRELGVRDVVVSPGSRSTPLAMMFLASGMNLQVDIDERGAAFFALGRAKATNVPVCLVCTSGTAVANYYPALLEAQTSRVPLIVLTGDRPHELRALGSPQTVDQIKVFGNGVNLFKEMPLCSCSRDGLLFARQMALEAYVGATVPVCGPVHLNFPFLEPLAVDTTEPGLFDGFGKVDSQPLLSLERGMSRLGDNTIARLAELFSSSRGLIVCGEGLYDQTLLTFAQCVGAPILADPLSNLRGSASNLVLGSYDAIFRHGAAPSFDFIVRFGRFPISKPLSAYVRERRPIQVVVDVNDIRDFTLDTTTMVIVDPSAMFSLSWGDLLPGLAVKRAAYVGEWIRAESHYRDIALSAHDAENDEGAYVLHMADLMQDGDLLFSANSMSIRFIDTFMVAGGKQLHFMCNRGLNGIDGTLSTALGAAGAFPRAALLCGDLAFLHDVNALHLIEGYTGSLTIVLLNNSGGGIFELLPQKSDEPWFEKLFSTPVTPDYASIAKGFGISYHLVSSLSDFDEAFNRVYGHGVSIIEIKTTLEGLAQRSNGYR